MFHRKPEGYKELLAYRKAASLQAATFALTALFPKTKTMIALADQMDRSARSGTKNIIEGWKRNTTPEYFQFLGFSIGSIEELKDDAADIAKGLYRDLRGVKGEMGQPINPVEPSSSPPPAPLNLIPPFKPFTEAELTQLRFYPLDPSLPPIVQLYLRAKEVLMLLHKLQNSLDVKMDKELTKPSSDRARGRIQQFDKENRDVKKMIEATGLVQLENGQWLKREEWEERVKRGEELRLFGNGSNGDKGGKGENGEAH